ncbi:hypothetical protein H072_7127 [Dactylellina haptotyla CBS 200.50]|uniref:Mid2 domain-containing protein n=1 Tax=Dactylellina haptotyla (strain CBS 200.50) TaxID=1284197 RepID=S8ADB1_DACHA|nr:hypothetical protein H072_7127 [Dactylellina haptotyla CBS 200.50]
MTSDRALLLLVLVAYFGRNLVAAAAQCYFPDGTFAPQEYQPCNIHAAASGEAAMCCALNNGTSSETCLGNGLCSGPLSEGSSIYWRGACTDRTWESPFCKDICVWRGATYNWHIAPAPVMLCEDEKSCCGGAEVGGKCCSERSGLLLATNFQVVVTATTYAPLTSPTTTPNTSAANRGTTTSSTLPSNTASEKDSISGEPTSGVSSHLKIAIGVSAGILIVSIIATAFLVRFCLRRKYGLNGPAVYEKNSHGPLEIGTSQTIYNGRIGTEGYAELEYSPPQLHSPPQELNSPLQGLNSHPQSFNSPIQSLSSPLRPPIGSPHNSNDPLQPLTGSPRQSNDSIQRSYDSSPEQLNHSSQPPFDYSHPQFSESFQQTNYSHPQFNNHPEQPEEPPQHPNESPSGRR